MNTSRLFLLVLLISGCGIRVAPIKDVEDVKIVHDEAGATYQNLEAPTQPQTENASDAWWRGVCEASRAAVDLSLEGNKADKITPNDFYRMVILRTKTNNPVEWEKYGLPP